MPMVDSKQIKGDSLIQSRMYMMNARTPVADTSNDATGFELLVQTAEVQPTASPQIMTMMMGSAVPTVSTTKPVTTSESQTVNKNSVNQVATQSATQAKTARSTKKVKVAKEEHVSGEKISTKVVKYTKANRVKSKQEKAPAMNGKSTVKA